jgi:hypothetical protein
LLESSVQRTLERLDDRDLVLDVGGWAKPFPRADWVVDLMPYGTRGLYGGVAEGEERFSAETWVTHDICDSRPWPFEDGKFDFAICSHTLEDVRDPVRVCEELVRVARAGYVEVPSRLEEQSWGVHGPWVGWSHHRWLVDRVEGGLQFVFKPGVLQARSELHFPRGVADVLEADERVESLFWEGSFACSERIFIEPEELHSYLRGPVSDQLQELIARPSASADRSPFRRDLAGLWRRVIRIGSR